MSDRLDELTRELEDAAAQLRAGELEPGQAATLVEECARIAALAGTELDRASQEAAPDPRPGQGERRGAGWTEGTYGREYQ